MREEDFDKKIQEITDILNRLHDDSNKAVGFIFICGYEDELKDGQLLLRVAGAGDSAQLALMTYVAAKDDKRYSMIFNAAIRLREEREEKEERELIPFRFFPTIDRSFGK